MKNHQDSAMNVFLMFGPFQGRIHRTSDHIRHKSFHTHRVFVFFFVSILLGIPDTSDRVSYLDSFR